MISPRKPNYIPPKAASKINRLKSCNLEELKYQSAYLTRVHSEADNFSSMRKSMNIQKLGSSEEKIVGETSIH